MVERIVQHRHCRECGGTVPPREEFCDEACRGVFVARMTRKRRQLLTLYGFGVAVLVLALLYLRF